MYLQHVCFSVTCVTYVGLETNGLTLLGLQHLYLKDSCLFSSGTTHVTYLFVVACICKIVNR